MLFCVFIGMQIKLKKKLLLKISLFGNVDCRGWWICLDKYIWDQCEVSRIFV